MKSEFLISLTFTYPNSTLLKSSGISRYATAPSGSVVIDVINATGKLVKTIYKGIPVSGNFR